jgi:RNA polymerase sigma factor (sigma-70 family)
MFLKLFKKDRPVDDLELVRQYRRTGDVELVGKLFERHTDMVYLVCLRYLEDEEESKDATMQVFEQLLTALRRHELTNFKAWLHTLTKNHCLQLLRAKRQRDKTWQELSTEEAEEQALSPMDARELELQSLEQGMLHLPALQRTCLELFYYQQKSYQEIVELTGCDLKQVKSYIQNGRRNLKIYVDKNHAPR